ncbi:MAG: hypothetical protein CL853_08435 [Crocinitomicaceae bacterium]|nr:hypothetical protein [Crocinitomicaceae bacterium]
MVNQVKNNNTKLLIVFYALIGYIILQFMWWAYHIINLTKQLNNDQDYILRRIGMIAGEAFVFIVIISLGVFYVVRSFRKEFKLAQRQKNFSLSVTHELKTPIASSKLFLETLLNRELKENKKKELLEKVILDQDRLQNLVDNILMASNVAETDLELVLEEISLFHLIEKASEGFPKTHKIINEVNKELNVIVDEFYYISVIQNLLGNAIKYSPNGSEIYWRSFTISGTNYFSISDKGCGIPKKERRKVFEMFYRIDNEETRTSKGTGLGLYLVENIVRLHKGEISIADNKQGCEFIIKIS